MFLRYMLIYDCKDPVKRNHFWMTQAELLKASFMFITIFF